MCIALLLNLLFRQRGGGSFYCLLTLKQFHKDVKMSLIYTVWWLQAINLATILKGNVTVRLFLASQQNFDTLHH